MALRDASETRGEPGDRRRSRRRHRHHTVLFPSDDDAVAEARDAGARERGSRGEGSSAEAREGRGRARGQRAEHARRHLRRRGARGLPRRTFGADTRSRADFARADGPRPAASSRAPRRTPSRYPARRQSVARVGPMRTSAVAAPGTARGCSRNPTASRLARDARTSPRSLGAARRSVGLGPWRARSPIPTTRRDRRRVVRPARPLAVPTRPRDRRPGRRDCHPPAPPRARGVSEQLGLARLLRWRPGWITSSSSGGRARTRTGGGARKGLIDDVFVGTANASSTSARTRHRLGQAPRVPRFPAADVQQPRR